MAQSGLAVLAVLVLDGCGLCRKVVAQLLLLFLGQIGVKEFELEPTTLDRVRHIVSHRAIGHQKQRRRTFGDLVLGRAVVLPQRLCSGASARCPPFPADAFFSPPPSR